MKTILFDLRCAQSLGDIKYHGGGEYVKSVYSFFVKEYFDKCSITVFFDSSLYLDKWIRDSFSQYHISTYDIKKKSVQKILDEKKYDVFFSGIPYGFYSLKIPDGTAFCGTIHGLRQIELFSEKYAYKYYGFISALKMLAKTYFASYFKKDIIAHYSECIKKLDMVFSVSNHTKYAIKNFFPDATNPVKCFYTPQKITENSSVEYPDITDKFILLISCDRFVKNSYRAIIALNNLFEKGLISNYKVVTVGKLPPRIKQSITHIEKFIEFDYVSPEKLEGLYAECDFFLYPTLNEGFGMPPLEAMKYGKTCIVSGVCSVPEVCGDAVYYINPYDISEMQTRILLAVENKISVEKIAQRLQYVNEKQLLDLKNLCENIFNLSKKSNC